MAGLFRVDCDLQVPTAENYVRLVGWLTLAAVTLLGLLPLGFLGGRASILAWENARFWQVIAGLCHKNSYIKRKPPKLLEQLLQKQHENHVMVAHV